MSPWVAWARSVFTGFAFLAILPDAEPLGDVPVLEKGARKLARGLSLRLVVIKSLARRFVRSIIACVGVPLC